MPFKVYILFEVSSLLAPLANHTNDKHNYYLILVITIY